MFLYELLILLAVVGMDIGSKYWVCDALGVVNHAQTVPDITVIKNVLSFSYGENTGASWGLFQGKTTALTVVTAIGMALLFIYLLFNKKESKFLRVCLVMILAGGLGNLYDRIVFGYVRDFIEFEFISFPTFNVADSFLTVATVLVVVYAIFFLPKEIMKAQKAKAEADAIIPTVYPYDALEGRDIISEAGFEPPAENGDEKL